MHLRDALFFGKNMRYSRSIDKLREQDYEYIICLLEQHLNCIQSNASSTNEEINEIKLMIQKIQHHLSVPVRKDFSVYKYW
ncbi:hypothetical protein NQ656_04480 [Acinetobacter baumannii]|nr:hypothetical protein [Acinetobacter baumannii]